jgi:hypothetical protein
MAHESVALSANDNGSDMPVAGEAIMQRRIANGMKEKMAAVLLPLAWRRGGMRVGGRLKRNMA